MEQNLYPDRQEEEECTGQEWMTFFDALITLAVHHRKAHGMEGTVAQMCTNIMCAFADPNNPNCDMMVRFLVAAISKRGYGEESERAMAIEEYIKNIGGRNGR